MNKHLNVLTHTRHMESPNLVASCVDGLDVSYLTSRVYNGIVFGPPTACPLGICVEDDTRAR
jgi:hypothetical protein